jgi:ADP-heptose:LPS heptosyltransferase
MGGIGDLLMMTPGLHALKRKHRDHEIRLAVPRKYAPLFNGNSDVTTLDIDSTAIDTASYAAWYNLTDCPAARIESRAAPNVTESRVELFSRGLGITGRLLRKMDKQPRYFISDAERSFQQDFWQAHGLDGRTVIGVQLQAAEPYRDYPHMDTVVRSLAEDAAIILFHAGAASIAAGGTVIDPGPLPLRQAFALAAGCDVIVAPDSAFVHFAAAVDVPCVALYGPIDGKVRTCHYPRTVYLDARSVLRCVPCWRNEVIPCRLTNLRSSACMENIPVEAVVAAVLGIGRKRA